jgi:hypothetical protein
VEGTVGAFMKFRTQRTPAELFSKRLTHIRFIQAIASDLDTNDVTRKEGKKKYLYESYIVYLIANWQTFIEHLAEKAFTQLVEIESSHMLRGVLRNNFYQALKKFNTPKTETIDSLIEAATGISKVSSNWYWDGMSNKKAKGKLAEILEIRHEIAHTASTKKVLTLEGNFEYMEFLMRLADSLNKVIDEHIEAELRNHSST